MLRTGYSSSSSGLRRVVLKWGAALMLVAGMGTGMEGGRVIGGLLPAAAAQTPENAARAAPVAPANLSAEAQATYRLILMGGPFPYSKDGSMFGNRERLLPMHPRGHYREYTVKTPGASNRGARRIVCGGKPPTQPEACYFTADHYASFKRIAP